MYKITIVSTESLTDKQFRNANFDFHGHVLVVRDGFKYHPYNLEHVHRFEIELEPSIGNNAKPDIGECGRAMN